MLSKPDEEIILIEESIKQPNIMDNKTKIKFDRIKLNCQAFYRVSSILWDDYSADNAIEKVMPIVVNSTFTCELALKAILVKCGQGFYRGHKLYNLFSELMPEIQDCVIEALKLFYPSQTAGWLVDKIKIASDNYQRARYSHDYTIAIDLTFCKNFMDALVFIEQKLCGLVIVEEVNDDIKEHENEFDAKINSAMTDLLAEAEKNLKNKA